MGTRPRDLQPMKYHRGDGASYLAAADNPTIESDLQQGRIRARFGFIELLRGVNLSSIHEIDVSQQAIPLSSLGLLQGCLTPFATPLLGNLLALSVAIAFVVIPRKSQTLTLTHT